jgi:hypothetical protein
MIPICLTTGIGLNGVKTLLIQVFDNLTDVDENGLPCDIVVLSNIVPSIHNLLQHLEKQQAKTQPLNVTPFNDASVSSARAKKKPPILDHPN